MLKNDMRKKLKLRLINLKVTDAEQAALMTKAKKYTGGNLSAWLRYAGTQLVPHKKDMTKSKKAA